VIILYRACSFFFLRHYLSWCLWIDAESVLPQRVCESLCSLLSLLRRRCKQGCQCKCCQCKCQCPHERCRDRAWCRRQRRWLSQRSLEVWVRQWHMHGEIPGSFICYHAQPRPRRCCWPLLRLWSQPHPLAILSSSPRPPPLQGPRLRVYTDVDHIGSTFGGTIDIDICLTFAGLFNRHWHFWSQSLIFYTFSRENAWKMSLFVCVCVCVCVYIYRHMIPHFSKIWFWFFGAFFPW